MKITLNYKDSQAKKYVQGWQIASVRLEELRKTEIKNANTVKAMDSLAGLIRHAILREPPADTSGLVEQQRYFKKLMPHE